MNSLTSSGINSEDLSEEELPHYVEDNSEDETDLVESNLSERTNIFNSFNNSRFSIADETMIMMKKTLIIVKNLQVIIFYRTIIQT